MRHAQISNFWGAPMLGIGRTEAHPVIEPDYARLSEIQDWGAASVVGDQMPTGAPHC